MNKIIKVGRATYVNIKFNEVKRTLSIIGVVSPKRNGNASSCGQLNPVDVNALHSQLSPEELTKLNNIWERWHLNNMNAGVEVQETCIRDYREQYPNWKYEFSKACNILKDANLYEVDGYKYGYKWIHEEVPEVILEWLDALPTTKMTVDWF